MACPHQQVTVALLLILVCLYSIGTSRRVMITQLQSNKRSNEFVAKRGQSQRRREEQPEYENKENNKTFSSSLVLSNVLTAVASTSDQRKGDNTNVSRRSKRVALDAESDSDSDSTSSSTSSASSPSSSFESSSFDSLNSPSWLKGPRWSNEPVPEDWLDVMMMQQPPVLLQSPHNDMYQRILDQQSMCYETGRFRHVVDTTWNASDPQQIHDWQFRLLYLAIHRMHHQPAFAEYQLRRRQQQPQQQQTSSILNFDYECPTAKFLVIYLWPMGMGATIRNGAMPPMLAALAMGRIPLFLQGIAPGGTHYNSVVNVTNVTSIQQIMTRTFTLTSCERHDLQCIFLPTSPCVITHAELRHPTSTIFVPERYARVIRRAAQYELPTLEQARILVTDSRLVGFNERWQVHDEFRKRAHHVILELMEDWKENHHRHVMAVMQNTTTTTDTSTTTTTFPMLDITTTEQWKVFQTVADTFAIPFPKNEEGAYKGDNGKGISATRNMRAALLYFMRPNAKARQGMQQQLSAAMQSDSSLMTTSTSGRRPKASAITATTRLGTNPTIEAVSATVGQLHVEYNATQYFGLPIRGSDKCVEESTCLEFEEYMDLMQWLWNRHGIPGRRRAIILTSEDELIMPQRFPYIKNTSFNFSFIVNEQDRQPSGGRPERYQGHGDEVMISSLVAMKLQLKADVLVGNCCSNFHKVLFDFAIEGCGANRNGTTYCVNEMYDQPQFLICCAWDKDPQCDQVRARFDKARRGYVKLERRKVRLEKLNKTLF